jgi:hypothetical protein
LLLKGNAFFIYVNKAGALLLLQEYYLALHFLRAYLCHSSLQHLSRKAEGNGPMKP